MLFSATMPSWVKSLAERYTENAVTIDLVGDTKQRDAKASILTNVIATHSDANTIVFVNTKAEADSLASEMGKVIPCEALHGDIAQQQREMTLEGFRSGRYRCLIATDVAARGLDLPDVNLVVHYDAPQDTESFLHRSGRTGRAGKTGTCILLYPRNRTGAQQLKKIEREAGCDFDAIMPPSPQEVVLS